MKKTIEIECPDGYKPVYNAETGKVEIVSEDITARVQTYEDACKIMSRDVYGNVPANFSVDALRKLHVILDALNEGHKFNLLTGTVWYPWVRFFRMKSVPKDAEVIGHFSYQGEKFALVGGCANYGGFAGLGYFNSRGGVGGALPMSGCLRANLRRLPNMYQLSLANSYSKLVLPDTSM